jgi:hypothetical protein
VFFLFYPTHSPQIDPEFSYKGIDLNKIFVAPRHPYVKILTPNRIGLGGGAFRRWLGHESRVLMNEICALIRETSENFLVLFSPLRI